MLKIGINLVKADYNRRNILVHHLTDDVTGTSIPICGASNENLMGEDSADGLLADIRASRVPLFSGDDDRMCERCRAIYLSPGSEEEKSERRLKRWKRKEAWRERVKEYTRQILERKPVRCPNCQRRMPIGPPRGYEDASGDCEFCGIEWTVGVLVSKSGEFTVMAYDDSGKYNAYARGVIDPQGIEWDWDEVNATS